MTKLPYRLVALLLVPCLVVDHLHGVRSCIYAPGAQMQDLTPRLINQSLFNQQAMADAATQELRPFTRMREVILGWTEMLSPEETTDANRIISQLENGMPVEAVHKEFGHGMFQPSVTGAGPNANAPFEYKKGKETISKLLNIYAAFRFLKIVGELVGVPHVDMEPEESFNHYLVRVYEEFIKLGLYPSDRAMGIATGRPWNIIYFHRRKKRNNTEVAAAYAKAKASFQAKVAPAKGKPKAAQKKTPATPKVTTLDRMALLKQVIERRKSKAETAPASEEGPRKTVIHRTDLRSKMSIPRKRNSAAAPEPVSTGDLGSDIETFEIHNGEHIMANIASADDTIKSDYYTNILVGQMRNIQRAIDGRHGIVKRCLDLGTGRGTVAILMGLLFSWTNVVAADINPNALDLAQANALRNGISARFETRQGDTTNVLKTPDQFDLVMFTLPTTVLPLGMVHSMSPSQESFINGGSDGRIHVDKVIQTINPYVSMNGSMYFTISSFIGVNRTLQLLSENGFKSRVFYTQRKYLDETIHTRKTAPYIEQQLGYQFPQDDKGRKNFEIVVIEAVKIKETGDRGRAILSPISPAAAAPENPTHAPNLPSTNGHAEAQPASSSAFDRSARWSNSSLRVRRFYLRDILDRLSKTDKQKFWTPLEIQEAGKLSSINPYRIYVNLKFLNDTGVAERQWTHRYGGYAYRLRSRTGVGSSHVMQLSRQIYESGIEPQFLEDVLGGKAEVERIIQAYKRLQGIKTFKSARKEVEAYAVKEIIAAYENLRDCNKSGLTAPDVLRQLQKVHGAILPLGAESLECGFRWLDRRGIPIRHLSNRWQVTGMARRRFMSFTISQWPKELRQSWRDTRGEESARALAIRLQLIQEANGLSWAKFVEGYASAKDNVWNWKSGRRLLTGESLSIAVEQWGDWLGIEPVLLRTGYPRSRQEPIVYRQVVSLTQGKRVKALRRLVGISRSSLASLLGIAHKTLVGMEYDRYKDFRDHSLWSKMALIMGVDLSILQPGGKKMLARSS